MKVNNETVSKYLLVSVESFCLNIKNSYRCIFVWSFNDDIAQNKLNDKECMNEQENVQTQYICKWSLANSG